MRSSNARTYGAAAAVRSRLFSGFASADADREEAAYYKKAAGWEKYSTDIKEMSFNRQLYQTLGTG
ncbi:MAG TPA: hypothetical protein VHW69_09875, partial [Rhizomicrobium sp.]|nr:hypothetical protein [Rhizomicrobium sp.]